MKNPNKSFQLTAYVMLGRNVKMNSNYGFSGLPDLSNNTYAAGMKELANGLSVWSGLLLLSFLTYQIVSNNNAVLFSLKTLLVIIAGVIIFAFMQRVGNLVLAFIIGAIFLPFTMNGKYKIVGRIVILQNIQTTTLVIFGFALCMFAWFFASYGVSYVYSAF